MTDIAALLANAAETKADFDFGKLNKSYWEGRDQYAKNDLRDAFKDGLPMKGDQPDWALMAKTLIQKGAWDQGITAANQGLAQQNLARSQQVSDSINGGAPLPVSAARPNGVADPAFRRDTSTDQPAQPATPLPADQQQDPQSDVMRMPTAEAVQDWRNSVRPAVGGAQPQPGLTMAAPAQGQGHAIQIRPQAQPAPPAPPQVAQAPQAPPPDFNSRFSAARPGQGGDTLGGLIPAGRDVPTMIRLLSQAMDTPGMPASQVANYKARLEAIYKAIGQDRADEATTARQELGDRNKTQIQILEKSIIPRIDKSQETANAARDDIEAIHRSRAELDRKGGIFSGAYADQKLFLAKVAEGFGVPNADKIQNTEAYFAAIGGRVSSMVQAFGKGGQISNSDRTFAEKMAGGSVTLDENSMRRILDIGEQASRLKVDNHNSFVDKAIKANEGLKPARESYVVKAPGAYNKPQGQAAPSSARPNLEPGKTTINGKVYKGGNPNDKANWELRS